MNAVIVKDYHKINPDLLINEILRYAGAIGVPIGREGDLTIPCPRGLNHKVWAEANVGRIRSFGVKAEIRRM